MGNSNRSQRSNFKTTKKYDPRVHKLHISYSRPLERDRKGFILSDCDSNTQAYISYDNKFEMSPSMHQSENLDISNDSIDTDINLVLDDCLDTARIYDEENSSNSDVLEENRFSTASLETTTSANSEVSNRSKHKLQNQHTKLKLNIVSREHSYHQHTYQQKTRDQLPNKRFLDVVKNATHSLATPPEWLERNFTFYN